MFPSVHLDSLQVKTSTCEGGWFCLPAAMEVYNHRPPALGCDPLWREHSRAAVCELDVPRGSDGDGIGPAWLGRFRPNAGRPRDLVDAALIREKTIVERGVLGIEAREDRGVQWAERLRGHRFVRGGGGEISRVVFELGVRASDGGREVVKTCTSSQTGPLFCCPGG